jgi:hypothetical protein
MTFKTLDENPDDEMLLPEDEQGFMEDSFGNLIEYGRVEAV